ncbi:MAG: DUF2947 domain-containing protein [Thalassotalea sp.]
MSYLSLDDLKNAWIFRHQSLPIEPLDLSNIKPLDTERSRQVWDTFISKQVDHPDFFKVGDWPFNDKSWLAEGNWETSWDSDEAELPEEITAHLEWDHNTVVYFCPSRSKVIETTWEVFQRCWKNFLFMDDGSILIGKKRKQTVQFLSNGQFKIGNKA